MIVTAATSVKENRQATPEFIALLENFPKFFDAVEKSFNEYEDRLKVATRNIEISSRELTTAYANVEKLNANINAMLDSLGQGLLFFNREGICSPVYSKACLSLLEIDPSHKFLPDALGFPEQERHNFESWLSIVFSDHVALDFNDMKKLLPEKTVNSVGHVIELDYRPMYIHEETLMGVLLIATDITSKLEAEEKMRHVQTEAHKIQQIAQNRNGFHRFLSDIESFLHVIAEADSQSQGKEDKNSLLRQLHTFKGHASAFSLIELSQKLHDIETDLRKGSAGDFLSRMKTQSESLQILLEESRTFARNLFGPEFMMQGRVLTVEMSKIEDFTKLIKQVVKSESDQEILTRTMVRNFLSVPIFSAFLSFERELARIAEDQGKALPECRFEGENLPIVFAEYEGFFNVLIHVARNIVDHGLEMPDERIRKGKPREGHVTIKVEQAGESLLRIAIGDDGQGIDPGRIRHKLKKERGLDLIGTSDEDVLQHIFDPEFSLRKEATILSGRGMGLNAIQHVVKSMGGNVFVKSGGDDNQGTEFIFELPYMI